jgi:uncharacterized protein YjbI with pentapeptide repeats
VVAELLFASFGISSFTIVLFIHFFQAVNSHSSGHWIEKNQVHSLNNTNSVFFAQRKSAECKLAQLKSAECKLAQRKSAELK